MADVKEALQVLDNLAAKFKGTRQQHVILQNALGVVAEAALRPDRPAPPAKTPPPDPPAATTIPAAPPIPEPSENGVPASAAV